MNYSVDAKNIILYENDFNLDETLDCGQAFRWKKIKSDYMCTYEGYFFNDYLKISQINNQKFILHDISEKDFLEKWIDYFDLNSNYTELKKIFSEDKTLSEACKFSGGIRLLRQNSWECLISFIISQNNNIPRIKGIIDRLCDNYNGKFPSANELVIETPDTLGYLRSGFRAKYITDAALQTSSGTINLDKISQMPLDEARLSLRQIKGVGPKVAECVLLFGMHRTEAFPIDVWMKRVLEEYYPNGFPNFLKDYAGIAQQYLFHYIRCNR